MSFTGRLSNSRSTKDTQLQIATGSIANVESDCINNRFVVRKSREGDNTNYSFSVSQIRQYDWIETFKSLIIITEDGREHRWSRIRPRLDEDPRKYQVVTL